MPAPSFDPSRFLPLKPAVLAILASLAEMPRHGYALMQAVSDQSNGLVRLDTGPLYRHLRHMLEAGLIEEAPRRAPDEDERRRYYRPTRRGRDVLAAEKARLQAMLEPKRHKLAPRG